MKTHEAIQKAKTATALASLLGISKSAVSHWGEDMPPLRVYQLKALKPSWFKTKPQKAAQ